MIEFSSRLLVTLAPEPISEFLIIESSTIVPDAIVANGPITEFFITASSAINTGLFITTLSISLPLSLF